MSKHDLENMIFNLEERKGLKKVEFTQKAVVEILGYLKELQDLETKLTESEKRGDKNFEAYMRCSKKYTELKQQHAEALKYNDKLIEDKNKMVFHIGYDNLKYLMEHDDWQILEKNQVREYKQLKEQLETREQIIKENKDLYDAKLFEMSAMEENHTQDKISFAVEQLEKVRFEIDDKTHLSSQTLLYGKVMEIIDNQIKQLKENKSESFNRLRRKSSSM